MNRTQKVLAGIIVLWGASRIIGGTRQIWDVFSPLSAMDALIVCAILAVTFGATWTIYKAFFAQYIDPVIRDSIASFQKNMGVTKG